MEGYGNHIVQYSPEYSLCTGCESCSIMCGLMHEGFTGPGNGRIKIGLEARSLMHTMYSCQQCDDHPCYESCPKKDDAMCVDAETGVVYINEEFCIGCGKCIKACKFDPPRIYLKKNKSRKLWRAVKCDLCRGIEGGPQCIKYCPVRCIGLSNDSIELPDGIKPAYAEKESEVEHA